MLKCVECTRAIKNVRVYIVGQTEGEMTHGRRHGSRFKIVRKGNCLWCRLDWCCSEQEPGSVSGEQENKVSFSIKFRKFVYT